MSYDVRDERGTRREGERKGWWEKFIDVHDERGR